MKNKGKLEMETLGKILLLTAFLIIFLVMFKGCQDSFSEVGTAGLKEYLCWGSNLLNSEVSTLFPTTCSPIMIEEPVTEAEINEFIRTCWWMYGKGEQDTKDLKEGIVESAKKYLGNDLVKTCYSFKPKEDIKLADLRQYLSEHGNSDKKVEKLADSTWEYLQEGAKEEAICFDKKKFLATDGILSKNKFYYINFYDERQPWDEGDRDQIMISSDANFGKDQIGLKNWILSFFVEHCYDPEKLAKEQLSTNISKARAKNTFNNAVEIFERCAQVDVNKNCKCENSKIDFNQLPQGYSFEVKQEGDKRYKLSLLKDGEIYKEGSKTYEKIINARIGSSNDFDELKQSRRPCIPNLEGKNDPYNIKDGELEVIYDPNNVKCCDPCDSSLEWHFPLKEGKDYGALYLSPPIRAETCEEVAQEEKNALENG
ncbi:MAG: hypothetical protein KKA79_09895 [Nanoarchaeota archaeon]|nr:hypothetical protein [Nanoarchaeota archaeon]MCG2718634.1 hypothetical protein [Nanoarchaeota archaeon]